jgi:hypothetical protein
MWRWSVVDSATSGQGIRSGALFFTPERIFMTDIIPLRSVFNLCYRSEILFLEITTQRVHRSSVVCHRRPPPRAFNCSEE